MVSKFENALVTVGRTGPAQRMTCLDGSGAPVVLTISPGPPDGIRNLLWVHLEAARRLVWTQDELRVIYRLTVCRQGFWDHWGLD